MSNFIILNNQVIEGLEIGSIFDSEKYDIFKGVTFSIDQKFAEKHLSNFKETTIVVGIQDSDVQERGLSLEQKQIKQLVDNTKILSSGLPIKMFENFSRSIQDRILEDSYQLSESQLSELKSELIPLLEEIQDKIYIKCYTDKGIPFNLSMSMKEIFDVLDIKNIHIFGSLFKTIDWYPKKIVLVSDFSHPDDFVSAVERFSFIRKLNESEEFDISAILISELEWDYNHGKPMSDNNGTEWVYKRHQQLSGMIKRKISNGYLFSKSCTENFEEKQKFLDVVLSYNTRMPIYKIEVEE